MIAAFLVGDGRTENVSEAAPHRSPRQLLLIDHIGHRGLLFPQEFHREFIVRPRAFATMSGFHKQLTSSATTRSPSSGRVVHASVRFVDVRRPRRASGSGHPRAPTPRPRGGRDGGLHRRGLVSARSGARARARMRRVRGGSPGGTGTSRTRPDWCRRRPVPNRHDLDHRVRVPCGEGKADPDPRVRTCRVSPRGRRGTSTASTARAPARRSWPTERA